MTSFAITPYRFTADVPAMVRFLEAVGLRRAVTADGLGFAVMAAEHGGAVGLHRASGSDTGSPAGETQLVFTVPSAEAAARTLREAGLDAITWDEAYGRHAGVLDPSGGGIWINEQTDLYGYQGHHASPGGGAAVTAVRYTADPAQDLAFFAAFGLACHGPADRWWTPLTGDGGGVLGLHASSGEPVSRDTPDAPLATVSLVGLGFRTARDLEELATELGAAGYPARVMRDGDISAVHVTDPDGRAVEIHPLAG